MDYKNLTKKEVVDILNTLKTILEGDYQYYNTIEFNINKKRNINYQENDLENLIGTIPFFLLNKTIFERNQDIADFAFSLGINIPTPEKKKREDIIGRIISAISEFDANKVKEINKAINSLKKTDINKGKSNFFKDWDNVIKEINI